MTLSIEYMINPNPALLKQAEDLLDSRTNVKDLLDREAFSRSFVVVIAVHDSRVIAVASIKGGNHPTAKELGYLMVSPDFRRLGIAAALTKLRMQYAEDNGLDLLYSVIKDANLPSIANMEKHGFQKFGLYRSIFGSGLAFAWYFYPLNEAVDSHTIMCTLTTGRISCDQKESSHV